MDRPSRSVAVQFRGFGERRAGLLARFMQCHGQTGTHESETVVNKNVAIDPNQLQPLEINPLFACHDLMIERASVELQLEKLQAGTIPAANEPELRQRLAQMDRALARLHC